MQKHPFKRQLHTTHVVPVGWEMKNSSPTACVWRWDLQKTCVLNKGETAVHGCHCPGDMVVRMGKVLAIPRLVRVLQCSYLVLFQIYLGTQANFSDPISIRMPWENYFTVPNQQLPLVYGGAGA